MIEQQDNQSNTSSQHDYPTQNKPLNRIVLQAGGLGLCSNFSGGNLQSCAVSAHPTVAHALEVRLRGNSDVGDEIREKCWFYFSVTGVSHFHSISFILENGNAYRKFVKEKKYRPYLVLKQGEGPWQPIYPTLQHPVISKDPFVIPSPQAISAHFTYNTSATDTIYIAKNYPYNLTDLHRHQHYFIQKLQNHEEKVYFNKQVMGYSIDYYPIYLYTVTAQENVCEGKREESLWGNKYEEQRRPFQLKPRPEIVITARVHPSQTSSSYVLESLVDSLLCEEMELLLEMFIFRIVPILNPDGVQNGHYRLDNHRQNLNRFYGHSSPANTPSIHQVEALLTYLRQQQRLFWFYDIHGHNSPKPSFIYGNHSVDAIQGIQNRTVCKLLENILGQGLFSYADCEFSKKNMKAKEKYDEHSKQASARVFAFRGSNREQPRNCSSGRQTFLVEHSYTVEICPYPTKHTKINPTSKFQKSTHITSNNQLNNKISSLGVSKKSIEEEIDDITTDQVMKIYEKIGKALLLVILEVCGLVEQSGILQNQGCNFVRKNIFRELFKTGNQYYLPRNVKLTSKNINNQIVKMYIKKYQNFLPTQKSTDNKYQHLFFFKILKQYQYQNSINKKVIVNSKVNCREEEKCEKVEKYERKTLQDPQSLNNKSILISYPKRCAQTFKTSSQILQISENPNFLCSGKRNNFREIQDRIRNMVVGNKISGEQLKHENPKIINTGKSHLNYQLMYVDTSNRGQQYHKNQLSTEKIDRVNTKRCRTNEQDFCQNARIDKNTHRISSNHKYFQPQYEKKQNHILVRNLLKKSHKIQRSRTRKEQQRGYSQIKTEPPQILRQDLLSYHNLNTKIILPPVLTLPDQGGKNKAIGGNGSRGKNKPQSTNKNAKLKLKKTEQEEQQIGLQGIKQMVQNNLSGVSGRMQFLTKAKKILAQKKLLQKIGVHGKMMEVTVNQRIVTHNTIPKT